MRAGRILIMAGIITMVMGNIFSLQGHSVIGPESSFMYSDPAWVANGTNLVAAGIILFGAGIYAALKY